MTATRASRVNRSEQRDIIKASKKQTENAPRTVLHSKRLLAKVSVDRLPPTVLSTVPRLRQPSAAMLRKLEAENLAKFKLMKRNSSEVKSISIQSKPVTLLIAKRNSKLKMATAKLKISVDAERAAGTQRKRSNIMIISKKPEILPLTVSTLKKLNKQNSMPATVQKMANSRRKADSLPGKRTKKILLTAAQLKKLAKLKKLKLSIPRKPRVKKPKEFEFKGSDWSGNSDDEGILRTCDIDTHVMLSH